ncbi:MMPL family transporter, partial [Corynebacterium nasicanis]
MASFLYRLGSTAYRRSWPFLAFWLILLLAVGGLAGAFAQKPSSTFTIPGLDSVVTMEKMQELFPAAEDPTNAPTGTIVIRAPEGTTLSDPDVSAEVDEMLAEVRSSGLMSNPEAIVDPVMAAQGIRAQMAPEMEAQGMPPEKIEADLATVSPLSRDETTGLVTVRFDEASMMDVPAQDIATITDILDRYNEGELTVMYNGNTFGATSGEINMTSEIIGLGVAALVLIITFGSIVAAGMPLISAIIGVAIGFLGIQLTTAVSDDISDMTPVLATMIGLAVGIDYALFIVSRFRTELIKATGANDLEPKDLAQRLRSMDRETRAHAMGMAVGTAGSAVIFAGLTVLIALAALSIINIPFLTAMALGAAATVALAVLIALTFLPALVGLLGTRVFATRVPGVTAPDPEDDHPTMGLRWVRR